MTDENHFLKIILVLGTNCYLANQACNRLLIHISQNKKIWVSS